MGFFFFRPKIIVTLHSDPYGSYRSPYGTAGSSELTSSGGGTGGTGGVMGFSSNLATGE